MQLSLRGNNGFKFGQHLEAEAGDVPAVKEVEGKFLNLTDGVMESKENNRRDFTELGGRDGWDGIPAPEEEHDVNGMEPGPNPIGIPVDGHVVFREKFEQIAGILGG